MLNVLVDTLEVYSAVYVDAAAMGVVALVDVGLSIQPYEAHAVVVVVFRSSWYGSDVYTHCVGSKLVISVGWTVPSPFMFRGAELMSCKISMSNRSLDAHTLIERALTCVVRVATMCSPLSGSLPSHKLE